jgi:signal peptidase I
MVLFWIFLAPPQLGGRTIYTATVGNSMEPIFHKGDLALARRASSYRVGDIVLYMSPIFHRPVLHRIIVIQDGRYYFKGDHNDFVDPGFATRHELLGKLWYHVPRAGSALSWFGRPSHAALVAGLTVLSLLLGGTTRRRRSKRGRRRRTAGRWTPPVVTNIVRRNLHRPRKSAENILGLFVFAVSAVLLATSFTTPVKKNVQLANAYRHTGSFTYSGRVTKPDAAYPSGSVHEGEPVFIADFKTLKVGFTYRFLSRLPHSVRGTIELKARMSADSITWHNLYTLQPATTFSGDRATVSSTVQLSQLRQLIAQLTIDSGAVGSEYTVELTPTVRYHGVVRGHAIAGAYAPVLPLTVTQSVMKVVPSAPTALPGATYAPELGSSSLAATLNPVQPGSVPGVEPTFIKLARYSITVTDARALGLALLALSLLVPLTKRLRRRRREVWSHEKRIAHRFGCVIVDVVSFDNVAPAAAGAAGAVSFESLATLARYCERPILHATVDGAEAYAVEDGGGLYVYRVQARKVAPGEPSRDSRAIPPVSAEPSRRHLRPVVVLFALAIAATLITGFTAANTVPISYANASSHTTQLSQLAPSQCSSLSLSALLVANAAATTGSSASELILGKGASGILSLNGGAGDDCIVGGGGPGTTDKIDGGTGTNVCIGAPGATTTFKNCASTY